MEILADSPTIPGTLLDSREIPSDVALVIPLVCRLVERLVQDECVYDDDRRKIEYRLTDKGFDLLPAMIALRQWGQKYGAEFVTEDPVLVDERDRLPIGLVSILSHDGRILGPMDLNMIARADVGKRTDGSVALQQDGLARGDVVDLEAAKQAAAR